MKAPPRWEEEHFFFCSGQKNDKAHNARNIITVTPMTERCQVVPVRATTERCITATMTTTAGHGCSLGPGGTPCPPTATNYLGPPSSSPARHQHIRPLRHASATTQPTFQSQHTSRHLIISPTCLPEHNRFPVHHQSDESIPLQPTRLPIPQSHPLLHKQQKSHFCSILFFTLFSIKTSELH